MSQMKAITIRHSKGLVEKNTNTKVVLVPQDYKNGTMYHTLPYKSAHMTF